MLFSLSTLEFDKVRQLLAQQTAFSAGQGRALALAPSPDPREVAQRQQLTHEAGQLRAQLPNLGLGGARDVTPAAQRASVGGLLTTAELLDVQATARVAALWHSNLARLERQLPTLAELRFGLGDHRSLDEAIGIAIDDDGRVIDSASPTLQQFRTDIRVSQDRLLSRLQALVQSSAVRALLQEPIVTQRGARYVVPVKAELRSQFKGIVHDQSASGATVFMEPLETLDLGNRVRQLLLDEAHEVERILRSISRLVGLQAEEIARTVDTLGELDLLQAKIRLADLMRATRPEIIDLEAGDARTRHPMGRGFVPVSESSEAPPVVRLIDARHPLLAGEAVPLSLELGGEHDVIIITGPNTGGKTVALKTVGLLALMAQAGLQVPAAEGTRLAVFESVVADIGDEQSIEQSLSTFSAHVTTIVGMLDHAGPRCLVLLDELGAGTDPLEGSALARALVECLLERRAYCVATTHYPELKAFAATTARVENASVEFDLETLSPTYRLQVGLPGQSNAFEIAARLGMPDNVVKAARTYLHPQHGELEELLEAVRRDREQVEAERARAAAVREDVDKLRGRLRLALADAERQRAEAWQHAREESEALLQELRQEVDKLRRDMSAARADRTEVDALARRAVQLAPLRPAVRVSRDVEDEPDALGASPLAVGQEVLVPGLGMPATILSIDEQQAELEVHGRRVRLTRARLAEATPASRVQLRAEAAVYERVLESPVERQAPLQLDLRGKRRDEAVHDLEDYLHDAYMAGLREVRVVHGRGTGAVRQAVREVLARHPLVSEFEFAEPRQGGDGATVVHLSEH